MTLNYDWTTLTGDDFLKYFNISSICVMSEPSRKSKLLIKNTKGEHFNYNLKDYNDFENEIKMILKSHCIPILRKEKLQRLNEIYI